MPCTCLELLCDFQNGSHSNKHKPHYFQKRHSSALLLFPSKAPPLFSFFRPFPSFLRVMPHLLMEQRSQLPPLCQLPDEIIEEIVSELDQHRDLVAFALASRICAALVIPHHTQYRILRMRSTVPDVWAHLARRADLARNVREVHICDHGALDHYPTTLLDPQLDKAFSNAEESVRIRNICLALGHMHRLHTFIWSWKGARGDQRPTSHPAHENSVLTAVSRHPTLEQLSLNGRFAMHALSSYIDKHSSMYPVGLICFPINIFVFIWLSGLEIGEFKIVITCWRYLG